jgi:hypothetical protein
MLGDGYNRNLNCSRDRLIAELRNPTRHRLQRIMEAGL